jgi:hypothetical protein
MRQILPVPNDIEFSGERKRVRCNEGLGSRWRFALWNGVDDILTQGAGRAFREKLVEKGMASLWLQGQEGLIGPERTFNAGKVCVDTFARCAGMLDDVGTGRERQLSDEFGFVFMLGSKERAEEVATEGNG